MENKSKKVDGRTLSANKIGKAGAKKKDKKDKVTPVQVYVKQSHEDAIGGKDVARKIALDAILNAPKRKIKI